MKSLVDFINEGVDYRISYNQKADDNGNVYRQVINVSMTPKEFERFNTYIKELSKSRVRYDEIYKPLEEGENFTTLGTRNEFCNYFAIDADRRFRDENTVINIKLK